jgi:hypothetical protein
MTPSAPARHAAPFDNALPTDFGNALPALRDCFGPLARASQ